MVFFFLAFLCKNSWVLIEMSELKSTSLPILISCQLMSGFYPIFFCSSDNFYRVTTQEVLDK